MPISNILENSSSSSANRIEILFDKYFYDVTDWIPKHPGGRIIEFYAKAGEDATLAIGQFHQRSTKKVMAILNSCKKRPATTQETIDEQTRKHHAALTNDYLKLFEELKDEGMFDPSPTHVTIRLLEVCLFAGLGFYCFSQNRTFSKIIGTLCFFMFIGRCSWLMHEAGHHSLTGVPKVDRLLQAVLLGMGHGYSSKWWSRGHNLHHAMPQRLKHDFDLETLPLMAFNSKVLKDSGQEKSFFIQNQAFLFLPIYTLLVTMLWKLYLSPRYVLQKGLYFQLALSALHYVIPYYIGMFPYFISYWLASSYLLGNFTLSHSHLPVTEEQLHWVEYSLKHTINIEPSWWCNWWMGYLNFQIEHHLFPTMPQFRHQKISDRVRMLASKHGLPYRCESYWNAVKLTIKNLDSVSKA